jgi:opacity protein-like surface antigen
MPAGDAEQRDDVDLNIEGETGMLGRTRVIGCMIVLVWSGAARAEAPPEIETNFDRDGLYLALDAAFLLDVSETDLGGLAKDTWGIEVAGGMRFHPYLAAELQLEYSGAIQGVSFGPRFKAYVLTKRVQPYLSFGIGLLNGEEESGHNEWGGLMRMGGGLDWYLTDNIVFDLTVEYLYGIGRWSDLRNVRFAVGPQYRF